MHLCYMTGNVDICIEVGLKSNNIKKTYKMFAVTEIMSIFALA